MRLSNLARSCLTLLNNRNIWFIGLEWFYLISFIRTWPVREGGELKKVYFLLTTEERPAGSGKYFARHIVWIYTQMCTRQGNLGYDQHTVPGDCSCRTYFCCSAFASRKHKQTYVHGVSGHSFKFLWWTVNSKPPTIPFGIVVWSFFDSLLRNRMHKQPTLFTVFTTH